MPGQKESTEPTDVADGLQQRHKRGRSAVRAGSAEVGTVKHRSLSRPPNLHMDEARTVGQRSWRSARTQILLQFGAVTLLFFCSRV